MAKPHLNEADIGTQLAPSGEWFALYTSACHEKKVSSRLQARDVEHFLPLTRSLRCWNNGLKVAIDQPLFAGYLFVKINRIDRTRILEVPGVHSLVSTGRDPIAVPAEEIEALRLGIESHNAEPHPYLNIGQRAKVRCGPLAGRIGIIVRKKNGLRFVLSIDLISKSISLEIDEVDLEIID